MIRTTIVIVAIMGIMAVSANAEIWYNADHAIVEHPYDGFISEVIIEGDYLYGDLNSGEVVKGRHYLGPGQWTKLGYDGIFVKNLCGSQTARTGIRILMWKIEPEGGYIWFKKEFILFTERVGCYVDHGGGPTPSYITYTFIKVIGPFRADNLPFQEEFRVLYDSDPPITAAPSRLLAEPKRQIATSWGAMKKGAP